MDLVEVQAQMTFALRRRELGWRVPSETRIPGDDADHLALLDGHVTAAVVSHAPWPYPDEPETSARYFFGMAVNGRYQRQGHGRRLLAAVADRARAAGQPLLWAEARESAIGFYASCGARCTAAFINEAGLTVRRVVFRL